MEYHPLPQDAIPASLRRNVDPASPPPMRLMAARGLVPAAPADLATVLYQLSLDSEAPVANAAKKTLADAPDEVIIGAAKAPLDAQVLDLIARSHERAQKTVEAVLLNRNTSDDTFIYFADRCSESISELIATNEVRLLRTPAIIEGLYMNPRARMSTLDRILDLARRNGVTFEGLTMLQQLVEDQRYDTSAAAEESAEREQAGADAQFKEMLEEALENEELDGDEVRKRLAEEEKTEEGEKRNQSLQTRMLNMTISERVRMAMLGSAQEREFLIKDNNRLVHMAAVTSPKVQPKDVVAWSGNRLMPDGVLAYIANHRRYRRMYPICVNLVNNPRTPIKHSTRILPTLVDRDLKAMQRNRNIPGALKRQVKALIDQRAKKR